MPQTQRDKIAQANTGKHLSPETRRKISDALTKYWAGLPFKPPTPSGTTNPPSLPGTPPAVGPRNPRNGGF